MSNQPSAERESQAESKPVESFEALPIHLVNLGKARPKAIKALKRGGGKLHHAVVEAIGEIEFNLREEAAGKAVLPVVVVVEKKRKRRSSWPLL